MSWRVAKALLQLRDEVDRQFPKRSKVSDGTIGDAAHASRTSDHNPWVKDSKGVGVVTAIDITDDDKSGADMAKLAAYLLVRRDPRIKYIIHAGRIASSYPSGGVPAWSWRPYSGINAHKQHMHVSVNAEPRHYDDDDAWGVAKAYAPKPFVLRRLLNNGDRGDDVARLRRKLELADGQLFTDAVEASVKAFQRRHKLKVDGVVGPLTAAKLGWKYAG